MIGVLGDTVSSLATGQNNSELHETILTLPQEATKYASYILIVSVVRLGACIGCI